MPRPLLFCDLAGTLEIENPTTGLMGPWPGAQTVLGNLARDHDLHLATGNDRPDTVVALREMGLSHLFTEVHADLLAGGKPFAALARLAGRPLALCLAIGDDPVADTALDTDEMVSILVRHRPQVVRPSRVAAMVQALGAAGSFRAGFAVAVAAASNAEQDGSAPGLATGWNRLPRSELAGGCRVGWWDKPGHGPRPVVAFGW